MAERLGDAPLATLFGDARTHNAWQERRIDEALLHELYALTRLGPTSANTSPARFVFVTSAEAREKLRPALSAGNLDKTMSAPCTVIVAHDSHFYEQLPKLFPHVDARPWFTSTPGVAEETAMRNGSLQAGYLIMAARALGLDAGPMSGFDRKAVDAAFLDGTSWKSDLLINLGYGDPAGVKPRLPRLDFDDACRIL